MLEEQVEDVGQAVTRKDELWAFGLLAVVLVPVLSVILVGGIGFVVWMQQIVFGPPGV